jgi:phosphoribosyl-ATP pyrophosphohydrolase
VAKKNAKDEDKARTKVTQESQERWQAAKRREPHSDDSR